MNIEDHRVREIESLNDEVYENGYQQYSKRIITQARRFARYNSSLLIIVGTILLIVLGGLSIYYFYDGAVDLLPGFISGYPDSKEEFILQRPQKLPCLPLIQIISSQENLNTWRDTNLDPECQNYPKKLNISGSISDHDFESLIMEFKHLEMLWLSGPEICDSFLLPNNTKKVVSKESESETHLNLLSFLNISNTNSKCDPLYDSFVQKIPANLTQVYLYNVTFTSKVEEFIQKLIPKHKISTLSLTNIQYTK